MLWRFQVTILLPIYVSELDQLVFGPQRKAWLAIKARSTVLSYHRGCQCLVSDTLSTIMPGSHFILPGQFRVVSGSNQQDPIGLTTARLQSRQIETFFTAMVQFFPTLCRGKLKFTQRVKPLGFRRFKGEFYLTI